MDDHRQRLGWPWLMLLGLVGLALGAHFLREGELGLMAASVAAPLLVLHGSAWAARVLQGLLLAGAGVWLGTMIRIYHVRVSMAAPYARAVAIMALPITLTLLAAWRVGLVARHRGRVDPSDPPEWRHRGDVPERDPWVPPVVAFGLTSVSLAMVHTKVSPPMLLAERFVPTSGWLELLLTGVYAAWLTHRFLVSPRTGVWRRRVWRLFSLVFFGQLVLGLAGLEKFLMTGKLHLPIPALIAAGPVFRGGEGLFMVFLLAGTMALVGPAWCSTLCYIGSWDDLAATWSRRRPSFLPGWARHLRWVNLGVVVLAALALRWLGVDAVVAVGLAAGFGLGGVGVMVWLSRKTGAMVHCVAFCPIGAITNLLGKLNPFRIRIGGGCTDCGVCAMACRYDALHLEDIARRRPGFTCTLCGDCVGACPHSQIHYRLPGLGPVAARAAFWTIVASLHAMFLVLARI